MEQPWRTETAAAARPWRPKLKRGQFNRIKTTETRPRLTDIAARIIISGGLA